MVICGKVFKHMHLHVKVGKWILSILFPRFFQRSARNTSLKRYGYAYGYAMPMAHHMLQDGERSRDEGATVADGATTARTATAADGSTAAGAATATEEATPLAAEATAVGATVFYQQLHENRGYSQNEFRPVAMRDTYLDKRRIN